MVDPGELVSATLKREFGEEALNTTQISKAEKHELEKRIESLFDTGREVFLYLHKRTKMEINLFHCYLKIYRGYVDDPRNTDNAWMETVAVNFHDEKNESVARINLTAGDDAVGVQWTDVDSSMNLYASHKQLIETVAHLLNAHW